MPICDCCRPLLAALAGDVAAFECTHSTPSVNNKRFSIKSRHRRFCRVGMDELMPYHQSKCDYAFACCPPDEGPQSLGDYPFWYFVELAGDRKSTQHCYDQLKASITFVRAAVLPAAPASLGAIEGFIIGSEPTTHRSRKRSDLIRELKDKFVLKDKLGRRLVVEKGPTWVQNLDT